MNTVLFSFIVPVYNTSARYLKESVQSMAKIKACTYEIILVDDGSTSDETLDALASYEKNSCIKVIHKENGGVSTARNTGLDIATGKYIAFVDSDDYIDTEVFENICLRLIKEYPNESVFLFTNYDVNNTGKFIKKCVYKETVVKSSHILNTYKDGAKIGVNWIRESVWAKIFTKEVIGKNRFAVEMKYGEDNLFILNVTLGLNSIICCAAPIYFYRWNDISATNCYNPTIIQDRMENILAIEKLYKKYHLDDACIDFCYDVISRTYLHLILRQWVFHKKNPANFKKKCILAYDILNNSYFKKKLNGIDMSRLRKKDKVIIWMLRNNLIYFGFRLFILKKPKFLNKKG
ncbi:MAG: glycosyltransferase [Lachnospiraceae bacterium]|nr:glycosyltransferase [Lachnospiraceae bacterium]